MVCEFPAAGKRYDRIQPDKQQAIGGNRSISGSFDGKLDDTTPVDLADYISSTAAAVLITLVYNDNAAAAGTVNQQKVSFNGWLSNISIGVSAKGEPNTVSANFTGTGAATWATLDTG